MVAGKPPEKRRSNRHRHAVYRGERSGDWLLRTIVTFADSGDHKTARRCDRPQSLPGLSPFPSPNPLPTPKSYQGSRRNPEFNRTTFSERRERRHPSLSISRPGLGLGSNGSLGGSVLRLSATFRLPFSLPRPSRRAVTRKLKQPTRRLSEPHHCLPIWSCSGWRLPRFTVT